MVVGLVMNGKKITYILIALAFIALGVHRLIVRKADKLELVASYIVYPVFWFERILVNPLRNMSAYWTANVKLQEKLRFAQEKIASQQEELIKLEAVKQLAEQTKELRDFASRYYPQGTMAHIMVKEFDKQHLYFVDAGSLKGIELDMIAIYKNCILGKISTVYPRWSKVTLLTDPSCKIAAFTATTHRTGIVEGLLSTTDIRLAYVSHLQPVKKGELVLSSGEGLIFPRGYGLGTIKHINKEGFNMLIDLEPLVDLQSLQYCYLVKKGAVAPYKTESQT